MPRDASSTLNRPKIQFEVIFDEEVASYSELILKMTEKVIGKNPHSPKEFLRKIGEHSKKILILAKSNKKVVGFKFGFAKSDSKFSSTLGGVLAKYRGLGIASEMMRMQHEFCFKKMKYKQIETHSANSFKGMMILNLKFGFDIVGSYFDVDHQILKIIFIKTEKSR